MGPDRASFWSLAIALIVLALLFVEGLFRPTATDAEPYHQRTREVIEAFPFEIDSWVGVDVPQPTAAVTLLKPNAILSRRYRSPHSRYDVTLLIVQCRDASDMQGHYPPLCYPSNGWTKVSSEQKDWRTGDMLIQGTQYQFSRIISRRPAETVIANFMILPDGTTARGIEAVNKAAASYQRQFYGAAQVQILCDAVMPVEERQKAVNTFLQAIEPLIRVMKFDEK